jgi:hypothetical protein
LIVQCIAIGLALGIHAIPWLGQLRAFLEVAAYVFVYATLFTTIGSGTSYVLKTRRILMKGRSA